MMLNRNNQEVGMGVGVPPMGGPGFGSNAAGGSFLPEDYVERRAERRSNVISLTLFGIVLFGVIAAFFVTNRAWSTVRTLQKDINKQYAAETEKIEQLKKMEAQRGEMLDKAEITTALIEKVPRSILLAELINRMPNELTLSELQMVSKRIKEDPPALPGGKPMSKLAPGGSKAPVKPGTKPAAPAVASKDAKPVEPPRPRPPKMEYTLILTGLAGTDEEVADYQSALKQCPLLDRVDLVSSMSINVDDIPMRKFRIEAQVRASADARRIEPLQVSRLGPGAFGAAKPRGPLSPSKVAAFPEQGPLENPGSGKP